MKRIAIITAILASAVMLNSCIYSIVEQTVLRQEYPTKRPPMVIKDVNGKPASQKWIAPDPYALPPSSATTGRISYAGDGLPYGLTTSFSDIIVSPYPPHNQLDYRGISPGTKVWDPYTRKPFYISRSYTFN